MNSLLFAMQPPAQGGGEGGSIWSMLLMFGSIIAIFYFMIIRPQQKRAKEREKLLDSVKKGDKIITAGGIHGTVIGIDEKTLLVQIADNVKIKIERNSISVVNKVGEVPAQQ
ncbi:MAG: preprotein translocase subunit YajC [Acidobacteriota bacterium]